MVMIPSTLAGSLAGVPLAQTKGPETDRAARESSNRLREINADQQAEDAAGIGATEEESATDERDADGRQVLEIRRRKQAEDEAARNRPPAGKDPSGFAGTQLDLEV